MRILHFVLAATATVLISFDAGVAGPPPQHSFPKQLPNTDVLRGRLNELDHQIERLSESTGEEWLTEQRAEEIRGLISQVLADADTRVSLLKTGLIAGWDDDFFIADSQGTRFLELAGQIQYRFLYNHQGNLSDDRDRWGFVNRRTKLKFKGYLASKAIRYALSGSFFRSVGVFSLEDAYLQFRLTDDDKIRIGRFRTSMLKEFTISSKRQLLAERSLIAQAFKQDRTSGIMFEHEDDVFRFKSGFMDAGTGLFGDQSWLTSSRIEMLLLGRWKQFKDLTSFPGDEPGIMIGAGFLYQKSDPTDPAVANFNVQRWTADISIEFGGANLMAAILWNRLDEQAASPTNQTAALIQGGFFLTDDVEIFSRYEWGDAGGLSQDLSLVMVGFNRYFDGHRLKFTADFGFGFNEVDTFWDSTGAHFRNDKPGDSGQFLTRLQFQLLF